MNLVLLIHAFMAAFLLVFRHKFDNSNFGIGASRTIDSGAIRVNRTYDLAVYNPRVVLPGSQLKVDCLGARAWSSDIEQMPLIKTFVTFIWLLFLFLSATVTDGVLAILAGRQPPYWIGGPYNVACLGLRWLGGIFLGLGNALPPFTRFCHGLVKHTLRWFGIFFYGLGNGLCDILVHIQLRYDAQMQQMLEGQRYFESEISARDQTINARDATIAANKHHHQSALMAEELKITQRDQLLTAARKENNELLAEVSRKDTELADEKAGSIGQRADIRILEHKLDIQSGKLPFGHDTLKKSDALGMPDGDKMALELVLYKKETSRLQRHAKHSELAGASYKRMVNANSDMKSERDQQQKENGRLQGDLNVERTKNVGLEKYVGELEKAVEDGVDQVSNLCQHQDELREKFGASQDQNVNQQRELLYAQGIINGTLDENERLQDLAADHLKQLGLAASTNARLQVEIDGAENAKTAVEDQFNGAMKTNTLLQGKVLSIQGRLNSASETKTQLEGKVLNIQGQLNGALKTKAQLESKVNHIQGKLNATKTQLLTQIHNVEVKLDGAVKTNAKLLRQSEKDPKDKSKLKSTLRKASLKNARLQKKTVKGRIIGFRKSAKASKEDRNDDWKDEGPDSGDDDEGDDDNQGNPAPPSTLPPSTPPPSTPPPSTSPPSTPPPSTPPPSTPPPSTSPPSTPPPSTPPPSTSPPSTPPPSTPPPSTPTSSSPPRDNAPPSGAIHVPVGSSATPSSMPAQDGTPLSAGNSTNDGRSGATVEGREVNGASDLPVVSSEDPSPSPAQDAPPLSAGNSMSDGGIGATFGRRQGDIASTVPINSSSPATNTATSKTETSQSNDTPEPIIPLPSTTAECIDDPNPVANSAPLVGNTETSEPDDGPKSTTPPPLNKAEHFSNDHKETASSPTGLNKTEHFSKHHKETASSPTGNVEASQTNDTSKLTTPLPTARDQGLFDIKPVTHSAPSASTVHQASPTDAALVPLPESPAALPADLVRRQDSEEALQASYAQYGLPTIDDEGLGEGEREDVAREKMDWEDLEQKVDQGAMDTRDDNVWRNEEEDVDMEDSDGNPPFEPTKPDDANQQAPPFPSNLDSQTCPTATDDDLDYLFEGDDINVDMDDEIFYGSDTTRPHEGTSAAGNDSESTPEVNVEMGEAGPLPSNPEFSNTQGNAGPVATPQQAPFIPPSQPVAPTSAPASTSPEFGTMSPYSGFRFPAVHAKVGGKDPVPASSASSQTNPKSVPPSQPSTAPLYCPTPRFSTPSRNAPQTSSSTPQPATPLGMRLTPEELRRGPSAFQASSSPSEIPRLHPRTTSTAPRSGSLFGAMAQSTHPPKTPSRPPSSSSSSAGSESEQPAGPSAPQASAVPKGKSAPMALPGLGHNTPCDFTAEIGTPIKRRPIAKPRARRTPFPAAASNVASNYSTVIDRDGKKAVIPEDDDEFAEWLENDLAREAEALDRDAAQAQPPDPQAPNTSSPTGHSDITDEQMAAVKEILDSLDREKTRQPPNGPSSAAQKRPSSNVRRMANTPARNRKS